MSVISINPEVSLDSVTEEAVSTIPSGAMNRVSGVSMSSIPVNRRLDYGGTSPRGHRVLQSKAHWGHSRNKLKQHQAEQSPQSKALHCVKCTFQNKNNIDLLADGGKMYAELTEKSITMLLEGIKQNITIDANDIFVDGGCSYIFMMAYIAQVTGCKVYGIKYVETRVYMGMLSALQALRENQLTNHKYIPCNMYFLESLGPAMMAIFFDEAFHPLLLEHICTKLVKPSTTLKGTDFFKPSKKWGLISQIESWGNLLHVDTIPYLHKMGSSEENTAYVFIPAPNQNEGQQLMEAAGQGLMEAVMMSAYLAPAWNDDQHICLEHYEKEVYKATKNLPQRGKWK